MSFWIQHGSVMTFGRPDRADRSDPGILSSWGCLRGDIAAEGAGDHNLQRHDEILGTTPMMNGEGLFFFHFNQAYTVEEVAKRLEISPSQVRALIKDGTMAAIDVGRGAERRDLRVRDEDLDDFAERRKVKVTKVADAAATRPGPKPGFASTSQALMRKGYAERRAARLSGKGA